MRAWPRFLPATLFVAAALLTLIAAPTSPAAVGQLRYEGCVANSDAHGCIDLPGSPLDSAHGVAVSPNGKSAYVVSYDSDSISQLLVRQPQGQLSWGGCLSNDGSRGTCVDLPGSPLNGAYAVAVSPDGRSVYVASYDSGSISHLFVSGSQGQLSWGGCLSNDGSQGTCVDLPGSPIGGASGVAVSPNGKSVYVTSHLTGSISHLFVSGPQGQLSWDGCLSNDSSQGTCVDLPGSPLVNAFGVAVSPNSRSVYVASLGSGTISHLFVSGAQGQLSWDGCLSNDGSQGMCVDLPGSPIGGASGVAVTPNGKSVYLASYDSGSISHLLVSGPQGQLSWGGCLSSDGSQGTCVDLPGSPLSGAYGVAVSPDGKSVYVTAYAGNTISHLFVSGAQGQPSWRGCLSNDSSQTTCLDLPGSPLDNPAGVVVSPGGRSVYVASYNSDSLSRFSREVPRFCAGRRATVVGTAGRDRLRGTRGRDFVAALGGNDLIRGLGGNDLVCAGAGKDTVYAGGGNDRVFGGAGRDTLRGGAGRDRLVGGPGRDRLVGGPGRDAVTQ